MRKKRRKYVKMKLIILLILIFLIFFISGKIIDKSLKPIVVMQGNNFANITAENTITECVSEFIEQNQYTYTDFANVIYDENGKVVSIEAQTNNINIVQAKLVNKINKQLENSKYTETEIPIGSLTNSYLLAGRGIKIPIRICPTGKTNVKVVSSFSSAGLNQTCHKISAVITAETQSSIPLYSFKNQNEFEYLIAETIIIGEIPQNGFFMT